MTEANPMSEQHQIDETGVVPPFEPDLELITHLEGNKGAVRRYRKATAKLLARVSSQGPAEASSTAR